MGTHLKQHREHEQRAQCADDDSNFHDMSNGSYSGMVCDIQTGISSQARQCGQNNRASSFLDGLGGLVPGIIQNVMTQVNTMIDHDTDNGRKHHHIDEIQFDMKDCHQCTG